MRAIEIPKENSIDVFLCCVNSIKDASLRERLIALDKYIVQAVTDYQQKITNQQLCTLSPDNSNGDKVVLEGVTKKELTDVYSSHMVPKTKPARKIYDLLLSRAPLGRCPFCGMGYASTLDHYLPKTKYPLLSVVPLNLVPSCKDCNTGKSTSVASTEETRGMHPYFDHGVFISEQWLFAKVNPTFPETISYFVRAPKGWDEISKKRIQSHFKTFNLAKRYSVEAVEELVSRKQALNQYKRKNDPYELELVKSLRVEFESYYKVNVNSWKTALYQALEEFYAPKRCCPICLGNRFFSCCDCPACNGEGQIKRIDCNDIVDKFVSLPCCECEGNNTCCSFCAGTGCISLEKAQNNNAKRLEV